MVKLVKQICYDCMHRVFQSKEGKPTACKEDLWQDQSINLTFPSRDWAEKCPLFKKKEGLHDA